MKVFAFSLLFALAGLPAARAQVLATTNPVVTASASSTPVKRPAQVQFKTSAVCDMCKARLERSLAYEKGVQAAHLDVPTKVLTVTYNPAKTTPAALRTAVQKTGYDADDLAAEARAYDRLPDCCKKTNDTH